VTVLIRTENATRGIVPPELMSMRSLDRTPRRARAMLALISMAVGLSTAASGEVKILATPNCPGSGKAIPCCEATFFK